MIKSASTAHARPHSNGGFAWRRALGAGLAPTAWIAAGFICLMMASPAAAQSTEVGGQIGSFIQNIVDLLNSSVIRGLAIIAVILTGIAWMFGHLDMRRAGTVVVGIIVIFSASAIVDLIVGAG